MDSVADLTGQTEILSEIFSRLSSNKRLLMRLTGPSGAGKSWLAHALAKKWQENIGSSLFSLGDKIQSHRSFYALHLAVVSESARQQLNAAKNTIIESTAALPLAGKIIRELLHYISKSPDRRRMSMAPFLSETERGLLAKLCSLAKNQRLLLICDDIQWWDKASLELLSMMLEKVVHAAFPQLANMVVLVVDTEDCPVSEPIIMNDLLKKHCKATYRLGFCSEEYFEKILRDFGLQFGSGSSLPKDLYRICGGHLEFARQLGKNAIEGTQLLDEESIDKTFLLKELIEQRLHGLRLPADSTISILRSASIIGQTFSENELSCLTELSISNIREILRPAQTMRLVIESGNERRFSHELIHDFFFTKNQAGHVEQNMKFAECLRLLSPGEYRRRAYHLGQAKDHKRVSEALALDFLSEQRSGRKVDISATTLGLVPGIKIFLEKMNQAWCSFNTGRYRKALIFLDSVEDLYTDSLLAERDILKARSHIKLLTLFNRRNAVEILSIWAEVDLQEFEVWGRVMIYYIVACFFLGDTTRAARAERLLMKRLKARFGFDPSSNDLLNRIRLKANMLHTSEVARERILQAIDYFASTEGNPTYDPVHAYIGHTNLSANRIVAGDFESAYSAALQGKKVVSNHRTFVFPRMDILVNNLIISGYFARKITRGDVISHFLGLAKKSDLTNDRSLIVSNAAWAMAVGGEYQRALKILLPVEKQLKLKSDFDGFYHYYVENNIAGCRFMLGDRDQALVHWKLAGTFLGELIGPNEMYYRRRHEIITGIFHEANQALDWSSYAATKQSHLVGPGWIYFRGGFLPSELEFWSDE